MLNKTKKFKYQNYIYLAQKNKIGIIGDSCNIENVTNFINWLQQTGTANIIPFNSKSIQNNDIPIFYRSSILLQKLKNISNLLILGCFPRFEAATLNLQLRKISRLFNNEINVVGPFNKHNFKVNFLGPNFKTIFNLFAGKHKAIRFYLEKDSLLILSSKNFLNENSYQINTDFYNQFFMKKFFAFSNDLNQFSILESNTTLTTFAELGISNSSKSFLNLKFLKKDQKPNFDEIWGLDLNTLENKNLKGTDLILFNTHNLNDWKTEIKGNLFLLPISAHFETTNNLLNLEGKIQKSYKATSVSKNTIKDFSNIVEAWSNFNDEFWSNWKNKNVLYKLEKQFTSKKRLNSNFDKKSQYTFFERFLQNQTLINFFKFNKNKYLFSFFYLFYLPKIISFKTKLFNFKNKIKNFYFTDTLTKNSHIMSLSTFFNLNNNTLPSKF